jgi:hypothetical protein
LNTLGQLLVITADDIDLQHEASVSSGSAMSTILCNTPDHTIGLGTEQSAAAAYHQGGQLQELFITGTELQYVSVVGLIAGGPICSMITVDGVTSEHNTDIGGIVTFVADRDDASIIFTSTASTFHRLGAQADNGVNVRANVDTDYGTMILDGDMDNSSTEDVRDGILIKGDRTITAHTHLELDSTHPAANGILFQGVGTLNAGTGILINDNLASSAVLVFNSDYESAGDGTLTLVATKSIDTGNSEMTVTA